MQNDIFLTIKGSSPAINGECVDSEFKQSLEILSFDIGGGDLPVIKTLDDTDNPPKTDGDPTAAGNSYSMTLAIERYIDNASPDLFLNYIQTLIRVPKKMSSAILTTRKSDGPKPIKYLVYEFGGMYVISYEMSATGSGEDLTPTEKISFRFSTVKMTYRKQMVDGNAAADIIYGWDFEQNNPL